MDGVARGARPIAWVPMPHEPSRMESGGGPLGSPMTLSSAAMASGCSCRIVGVGVDAVSVEGTRRAPGASPGRTPSVGRVTRKEDYVMRWQRIERLVETYHAGGITRR